MRYILAHALGAHHLFVSYSRLDDRPRPGDRYGWVSGFLQALREEHRRFTTEELAIFFDQEDVRFMDDWRLRLGTGLRDARLFLAFLSPNYFRSDNCRWEWEAYVGHESARAVGDEGIACVYLAEVAEFERASTSCDVTSWTGDLRRRQYLDLRPWYADGPGSLRQEELRARLALLDQQLVDRLERAERAETAPGSVARHNPGFVGRRAELVRLREILAAGTIGVVTTVHGLGGVGKTALATEYAHAHAADYPGGRWLVGCEGHTDLRLALLPLASTLQITFTAAEQANLDLSLARLLRELEKQGQTRARQGQSPACLLVLDNVDHARLLEPAMLDRLPRAGWLNVLVTTRLEPHALGEGASDRAFVALDELPEGDAVTLLAQHRSGGRFDDPAEREAAAAIGRELGGLSLAVEAVAVYLGQNPEIGCAEFLGRLRAEGLAATDTIAARADIGLHLRHREKVVSVALAPTLASLTDDERLVLELASRLHPDQVPLPWLKAVASRSIPRLAEPTPAGHPDPWRQIERRLRGTRLFLPTADHRVVRLHRLIGDLVRRQSAARADAQETRLVVHALERCRALDETRHRPETLWELEPLRGLADALIDRRHRRGPWVANSVVQGLTALARFKEAESLARKALALDESLLGPNHVELVPDLSNLATLLAMTNRHDEAEPVMRRALVLAEAARGSGTAEVAASLNNLATILVTLGRYADAEPLIRRALDIEEAVMGGDDPEVAVSLGTLAGLLMTTNRRAEAEPLLRRALAIQEAAVGSDHPHVAMALGQLAGLLVSENQLAEAERLLRRALALHEAAFGGNHPNVAHDLDELAGLLRMTNRYGEAEPLMRRALAIQESSFGPAHPHVAHALINLVRLFHVTGRAAEAKPLMERALEIHETSFGVGHPEVGAALNDLSRLLVSAQRFAEAEVVLRRALAIGERSLGAEHPAVASALNELGRLLLQTGRPLEAEPLFERALAIDQASFGPRHPRVATLLSNLGQVLVATERLAQGEAALAQALEIEEEVLGAWHPDVARELLNLGTIAIASNRLDAALPRFKRSVAILFGFSRRIGQTHPLLSVARDSYLRALRTRGYTKAESRALVDAACSLHTDR